MGRLTTTFTRAYGISCGGVTRCNPAEPTASALKRCSASWEYCNSAVFRWSLVRESAVKPVGKPDAGNPHVRLCVQRKLACSVGGESHRGGAEPSTGGRRQ